MPQVTYFLHKQRDHSKQRDQGRQDMNNLHLLRALYGYAIALLAGKNPMPGIYRSGVLFIRKGFRISATGKEKRGLGI